MLAFRKFWCILTRSTLIDAQETTKDNTIGHDVARLGLVFLWFVALGQGPLSEVKQRTQPVGLARMMFFTIWCVAYLVATVEMGGDTGCLLYPKM